MLNQFRFEECEPRIVGAPRVIVATRAAADAPWQFAVAPPERPQAEAAA